MFVQSVANVAPGGTGISTGDGFVVAAPPADECTGTISYEFVFSDASGARSTAVWNPEFGEIVTETIFAWPGVGQYALTAILRRDFPAVQGTVLFLSLVFVLVNLAVDLLYGFLDPRIRRSLPAGSGA